MKKLMLSLATTASLLASPAFAQWDRHEADDCYPDEPYNPMEEREDLLDAIARERAAKQVMPANIPAKMTAFCKDKTFDYEGWFIAACAKHGGVWLNLKTPIDTPATWKRIRELDGDILALQSQLELQPKMACEARRKIYGPASPC
jgi:hypothetical protein